MLFLNSKSQKVLIRILTILLMFFLTTLNFSGLGLAFEGTKITEQQESTQSSEDTTVAVNSNEIIDQEITSSPLPSQLGSIENGTSLDNKLVTRESNITEVEDNPKQTTSQHNIDLISQSSVTLDSNHTSSVKTISKNDLYFEDLTSTTSSAINIGDLTSTTSSGINIGDLTSTTSSGINISDLTSTTSSGINIGSEQNGQFVSRKDKETYPIKNKDGLFTSRFTSKSGQNLLRFSYGNAVLTMSPLNSNTVTGKIKKNTILYEGIYADTDLRYTVNDNHLKEEIMVNKYNEQKDFYFNLIVSNTTYQLTEKGTINFFESGTSNQLFYMDKSYALDKDGNRCDAVDLQITAEGLLMLTIDAKWLKEAAYPIVIDPSIYLVGGNFIRSSVAYNPDGTQVAANMPRYQTGKFNQAVMIEEGATNILTANQSSAETDLAGWSTYGAPPMSRVTGGWNGSYAVQCNLNAGDSWVGFIGVPYTSGSTYTFSVYAKGTPGGQINLHYYDGIGSGISPNFILTGVWQRFSYTFTLSSVATTLYTFIRDPAGVAQTFYLDGCQVENNAHATSWMVGGTTRATETMTVPTAGVINATQGSIEVRAFIDPAGVHSASNPNWSMIFSFVDIQASPYQERNQISFRRSPNSTNWGAWFSNASGSVSLVNLGSITTAGWYSFGITWQAGVGGYGYLNGVNKGNVAASYLPTTITASKAYIGSWTGVWCQQDQLIDDLRISNRLRTDAEIITAYQSNQPLLVDEATTFQMSFDGSLQTAAYGDGKWHNSGCLQTARMNFGAVTNNDMIYSIGGSNNGSCLNSVEIYDPLTGTSTTAGNLNTARYALGVAATGGKIYAIGGYNGGYINTIEEYDPSTNIWTIKTNMPTSRAFFGAAAVNGKIYLIGGINNAGLVNTVEEYDPSVNTWTTKANMLTARSALGVVAVNNKIYAIGGSANWQYMNTVEAYDPSTNTWTAKTNMPAKKQVLGVAATNDKIYTMGGYNNTSLYDVYQFDPNATINPWTSLTNLVMPRYGLGATAAVGKIYVLGGYNGGYLSTVEEYGLSLVQQSLLATKITATTITLSWPAASNATGYDIEVDGTVINNGTNTLYVHSGLLPNTTHTYRFRSRNASYVSNWSTSLNVVTVSSEQSKTGTTTSNSNIGDIFNLVIVGNSLSAPSRVVTITYNAEDVQIIDLCGFTNDPETITSGPISGTNVTINQNVAGTISFSVALSIPTGKSWSGVLNILKFKAKVSNPSISYTIQ